MNHLRLGATAVFDELDNHLAWTELWYTLARAVTFEVSGSWNFHWINSRIGMMAS